MYLKLKVKGEVSMQMPRESKKPTIKSTPSGAVAVELNNGESHVVGIGNLKVLIIKDGPFYYAQGLEIDYGAQGSSIKEAKANFQSGLYQTIALHIETEGHIDGMLKFAPDEILLEASRSKNDIHRFAHVSAHEIPLTAQAIFPFRGIEYLSVEAR